jgi:hypothetical protein
VEPDPTDAADDEVRQVVHGRRQPARRRYHQEPGDDRLRGGGPASDGQGHRHHGGPHRRGYEEQGVAEPQREPGADAGLEGLPVDAAHDLGPVVRERRLDLDPVDQRPEAQASEVGVPGVHSALDAGQGVLIVLDRWDIVHGSSVYTLRTPPRMAAGPPPEAFS